MPELGELLFCDDRAAWRTWLQRHHGKKPDVWLVYHKKASGKPFVDYDAAVEEALCFGWIDGVIKSIPDTESRAQRWTPRRARSNLSALNAARIRKMERLGKMTAAGRAVFEDYDAILDPPPLVVPQRIRRALEGAGCWDTFCAFPEEYRRLKVGWIDMVGTPPEESARRLAYLVKMTAQGKMYGTMP